MTMTTHLEGPSADIELVSAAAEQEPIVANLLELYGHDFSEFLDLALGSDGKMGNHGVDHLGKVLGKHFKAAPQRRSVPKTKRTMTTC
jgi:hypothetical protein